MRLAICIKNAPMRFPRYMVDKFFQCYKNNFSVNIETEANIVLTMKAGEIER